MRRTGAALASLACASGLVVAVGASVPAVAEPCPPRVTQGEQRTQAGPSPLIDDLDYEAVHALVPSLAGVSVAVLDTGVRPDDRLDLGGAREFGASAAIESLRGTEVAGVIGARGDGDRPALGVAPGVRLIDLQVADVPVADDGEDGLAAPSATSLVAALRFVVQNAERLSIKVVAVPVGVSDDPGGAMRAQVEALDAAGILVVAAQADADPEAEAPTPGSAQAESAVVYPAGFDLPNVIAVASTPRPGESATSTNQPSERTDVVAPSAAVTIGPGGGECEVEGSTAYATAVVSGVAALLFAHDPAWNARQVRARIIETAGGVTDASNPYAGAGSVQPYDALTRDLDIDAEGEVVGSRSVPRPEVEAVAPEMPDDPLAQARTDFVWWGLIGGAGIVLALVLRPGLQRLRRH